MFVDPSGLNPSVYDSPIFKDYREGYRTLSSRYNCHGHAVGRPIQSDSEDEFVRKHEVTPNAETDPAWNPYPYNELKQNYHPVGPPFRPGDTLLYGHDVNGKNGIFENIYYLNGKAVDEIKHTSVILEVDGKGLPTLCESKMGKGPIKRHKPNDPGILRKYGFPTHVFRVNKGAKPNRVYGP